jgi:hypothetical protein
MMFQYDFNRLNTLFKALLNDSLSDDAWTWLAREGARAAEGDVPKFNIAFVAMPRKTGKGVVKIPSQKEADLRAVREGLQLIGWSADRLARVWLLMQLAAGVREKYVATIENLFLNGEMSELAALYSSLPLLAYPDAWKKRCAEGIRNNIGLVLDAVICNNPYPSEQLDEAAWNQMVLKAIFTEKPLLAIAGLERRMNPNLAVALTDYAHERWAAHRPVTPLLWICVAPYLNKSNIADIRRLFSSEDLLERYAAALVCYHNTNEEAARLLDEHAELKSEAAHGKITWLSIATTMGNQ